VLQRQTHGGEFANLIVRPSIRYRRQHFGKTPNQMEQVLSIKSTKNIKNNRIIADRGWMNGWMDGWMDR